MYVLSYTDCFWDDLILWFVSKNRIEAENYFNKEILTEDDTEVKVNRNKEIDVSKCEYWVLDNKFWLMKYLYYSIEDVCDRCKKNRTLYKSESEDLALCSECE